MQLLFALDFELLKRIGEKPPWELWEGPLPWHEALSTFVRMAGLGGKPRCTTHACDARVDPKA